MTDDLFSPSDVRQMAELGIAPEEAARHVELFRNPPPFTRLLRPCRPGDGIRTLREDEHPRLLERFDAACRRGRIGKLVPASGAASRMFKALQSYLDLLEAGGAAPGSEQAMDPPMPEDVAGFFANLPRFAFFADLAAAVARRGLDLASGAGGLNPEARRIVLAHLLTAAGGAGLDYAELPKGLILFHRYPDRPRTPFEEHLVEAAEYTRDDTGLCRLHLTVSPQHEGAFRRLLASVAPRWEERAGAHFAVSFSHQRRSTDTLAVESDNRPFRLADGSLLFRPGGHGALLENLQELAKTGADVVLLKNIDNVVPDRLKPPVVLWKKLLAGYLLELAARAGELLAALDADLPDTELMEEARGFLERDLGRRLPGGSAAASVAERKRLLVAGLERPLRVCGVVRNQGEPGGGPFWVESAAGEISPQIVEISQIEPRSGEQQAILRDSTHFNPVDIACALRDRAGRPFDLARFVDPSTVFIAAKSHEGRPLKALERPGMWNGAMAGWNTAFVEVPDETFAPVKTVLDLLRPEHQPDSAS
ncbi:MAG TPA: DUF4301 family protein [Thermoanaerobaculia bacterium]|nr:DUF4301 family protein [Thermoanaerobaculia bacterium]